MGANPFLAGSARLLAARESMALARKGFVSRNFVSYSPSTLNRPLPSSQKRTDRKKGSFLGRFGRKTEGWSETKSILFCPFSCFGAFFRLYVIVRQPLANSGRLPKKSRQKTYRRFFYFQGLWHHRGMNDENEEIMRRNKLKNGEVEGNPRPA
jgi:hypothetical protein